MLNNVSHSLMIATLVFPTYALHADCGCGGDRILNDPIESMANCCQAPAVPDRKCCTSTLPSCCNAATLGDVCGCGLNCQCGDESGSEQRDNSTIPEQVESPRIAMVAMASADLHCPEASATGPAHGSGPGEGTSIATSLDTCANLCRFTL